MENKYSDELNALSSQVLDYYRRYSQNRNFSSYLRGNIPNSDDRCEDINSGPQSREGIEAELPSLVGSDNNENDINLANITEDQGRFPSPTSSITSNRKLEWDNLGDIGYGNCVKQKSLQKSVSLPVLTTLEKINLGERKLGASDNTVEQGLRAQNIAKRSSLSKDIIADGNNITPSTTSLSGKENLTTGDVTSTFSSLSKLKTITTDTDTTDFEYTARDNRVSFVQSHIGVPMAESTPNTVKDKSELKSKSDDGESNVKLSQRCDSHKRNPKIDDDSPAKVTEIKLRCVAACLRSNIKHLSVTKPIVVECCNYKKIRDKDIQTSTLKDLEKKTVAVQTDQFVESDENIVIENKIHPVLEERRLIEYVKHGNSPDEPSLRSLGTNTNSTGISQCNSFEYLYEAGLSGASKLCSSKSSVATSHHTQVSEAGNSGKTISENENVGSSNATNASSKASPLADLISIKLSKHVVGDVEKSIGVLQKLLQSKKYDKVTKQYYIKKIVQKIINCNYSSESSVNSEIPTTETTDRSQPEEIHTITGSGDAVTGKSKYQKAVPQMPPIVDKILPKQKRLQIKTFSTEILPGEAETDGHTNKHPSKLKDTRFTITNNCNDFKASDNFSQIGDTNQETSISPTSSPYSPMPSSHSSGRSNNIKNWKENMTKSEMLLEEKLGKMYSGDSSSNDSELLKFAKKERANQINWINNEICHLNKLKDLLQRKKKRNPIDVEELTKPRVEEITKNLKTTSVYVITTQKSSASSGSTYRSSVRSDASKGVRKKCECLFSKGGAGLHCDSSDCPLLNYRDNGKLDNMSKFDKILKKDIRMLPHMATFPEFECNSDIENAKLIAHELYPGHAPNTSVRRFVFEMPLQANNETLEENYNRLLGGKYDVEPLVPKLPDCDVNADTRNAKLIASEVCEGSLPNTCVRRYVFEIPVREDEVPIGKRSDTPSKSRRSTSSSPRKNSGSSRESASTKSMKCKCRTVKTCNCDRSQRPTERGVGTIEFVPCEPKRYESSDLLCVCQVAKSGKNSPEEDPKRTIKVVQTDVFSDPRKNYRVCVKQTGTGDTVSYEEMSKGTDAGVGKQSDSQKHTQTQYKKAQHDDDGGSPFKGETSGGERGRKILLEKKTRMDEIETGGGSDEDHSSDDRRYRKHSKKHSTMDDSFTGDVSQSSHASRRKRARDVPEISSGEATHGAHVPSEDKSHSKHKRVKSGKKGQDKHEDNNLKPPRSAKTTSPSSKGRAPQSASDDRSRLRRTKDKTPREKTLSPSTPRTIYASSGDKSPSGRRRPTSSRKDRDAVTSPTKTGGRRTATGTTKYARNGSPTGKDKRMSRSVTPQTLIGQQKDRKTTSGPSAISKRHHKDKIAKKLSPGAEKVKYTSQSETRQSSDQTDSKTTSEDTEISTTHAKEKITKKGSPGQQVKYTSESEFPHIISSDKTSEYAPISGGTKTSAQPLDSRESNSTKWSTAKDSWDSKLSGVQSISGGAQKSVADKTQGTSKRCISPEEIFNVPFQAPTEEKDGKQVGYSHPDKPQQYSQGVNTDEKSKENKGNQYEPPPDEKEETNGEISKKNDNKKESRDRLFPFPLINNKSDDSNSSQSDSSDSSVSSDDSEDTPRICLCCNRADTRFRSKLRALPDQLRSGLCEPCYVRNQQMPNAKPYYTYPGHVCSCYTVIRTETVRNIQRTVEELEDLERERDFCSCSYGCRMMKHTGRRGKPQKSVAYTLTFEDAERSDSDDDRRKHKKPPLEEVRVKIPRFVKKSHKDRENRRKSKHHKHGHQHHKKNRNSKNLTLQDHLLENRPKFIASAEERRRALIELAYMREERCQKYKQLLAMSNGVLPENNVRNKQSKPKMFTSKQMKEITAKNYKKLPEVQKKLEDIRNEQIKKANKILSDIFNKRLQDYVLKGKLTLSTSASVIKLP